MDKRHLEQRLRDLCGEHDVPGASIAVLAGDEVATAATGVLNRETGVEATPDSLFQIGSITKPYTASLVMRFVERGELDLDVPVATYLPELRVSDAAATRTVTLRHLLSHSSGIDGDHFLDTGRGDDVLERYVASCSALAQQFPVGATMSYCNAGFGIAGRVLEKVSGRVWDQVLREELLEPLALEHTMTLPEEVLRFRAACGHVGEPGSLRLTPQWGIPRSSGPAGLINATAEDTVAFARVFLDRGRAPDGTAWLAEPTVAAMLEPQVAVPDPYTLGSHWGVGWILFQDDGQGLVYGHDGSTLGQAASLRIVPHAGVAVALLMNGGATGDVAHALLGEVVRDTAGVTLRPRPEPVEGASGGDRTAQTGTYRRASATYAVVERGDDGLAMTITNTSDLAAVIAAEPVEVDLMPVREDLYVGRLPGSTTWTPAVFFALPDGAPYLHFGARATQRVDP